MESMLDKDRWWKAIGDERMKEVWVEKVNTSKNRIKMKS